MKTKNLLKKLATLCLGLSMTFGVITGVVEKGQEAIAAAQTVKYTISTYSSVTKSGTAPTNSSATFSNTYTSNKEQMTKDNSMNLTLSGYAGYKITGLKLNMHSNKSAGAGTFSIVAGTTTLAEINTATIFTKWFDNTSYGTSYRIVNVALSNNSYAIATNETVVISLNCTTNSLYCSYFEITYDTAQKTKQTISGNNTAFVGDSVSLTSNATSPTWSIVSADTTASGASVTTFGVVTVTGPGTVKVQAEKSGYETAVFTITFSAKSDVNYYTVTSSLENGSLSSTSSIEENGELSISINPNKHYSYPTSISIKMGDNQLIYEDDFLYDNNDGAIYIGCVTGDIVISGSCVENDKYSVTYKHGVGATGDDKVNTETYYSGGVHTLISFADSGFALIGDYKFKCWQVANVEKNPGESIEITSNTVITALFYDLKPTPIAKTISELCDMDSKGVFNESYLVSGYLNDDVENTTNGNFTLRSNLSDESDSIFVYHSTSNSDLLSWDGTKLTFSYCTSFNERTLTKDIKKGSYIYAEVVRWSDYNNKPQIRALILGVANISSINIGGTYENSYKEGQTFKPTGMTISATYSAVQGSSNDFIVPSNVSIPLSLATFNESPLNANANTYDVSVCGVSQSVDISVAAKELTSISANTSGTGFKSVYLVGDQFVTTGITATAVYESDDPISCTPAFSISNDYKFRPSDVGEKTIYVFCEGHTQSGDACDSFTVTVKSVTSISASDVNLYIGESFDKSSVTVTATLNDSSTTTLSSNLTFDEANINNEEAGSYQVPITYEVAYGSGEDEKITVNTSIKVSYSIKPNYQLIKDINKLEDGISVLIVNSDATKVLSKTQNTNNRGATNSGNLLNNEIVVDDQMQILTLKKSKKVINETEKNVYEFYTGSQYLYSPSTSSYLKSTSTSSDNSKWTIEITNEGVATIKNVKNTTMKIQYNASNTLFSCYSSSQTSVKIYAIPKKHNITSFDITSNNVVDSKITINKGDQITFSETNIQPINYTTSVFDYSLLDTSDKDSVTLSEKTLTGVKAGIVYVKAVAKDTSNVSSSNTIEVTVLDNVLLSISVTGSVTTQYYVNDVFSPAHDELTLTANYGPEGGTPVSSIELENSDLANISWSTLKKNDTTVTGTYQNIEFVINIPEVKEHQYKVDTFTASSIDELTGSYSTITNVYDSKGSYAVYSVNACKQSEAIQINTAYGIWTTYSGGRLASISFTQGNTSARTVTVYGSDQIISSANADNIIGSVTTSGNGDYEITNLTTNSSYFFIGTNGSTQFSTISFKWEIDTAITPTLESISASSENTSYYAGQTFNSDGLVVEATYSNGAVKTVDDYTVDTTTPLTTDKDKVQVTYGNKTADIEIDVEDASLIVAGTNKMSFTGRKNSFVEGEKYSFGASYKLEATLSDDSKRSLSETSPGVEIRMSKEASNPSSWDSSSNYDVIDTDTVITKDMDGRYVRVYYTDPISGIVGYTQAAAISVKTVMADKFTDLNEGTLSLPGNETVSFANASVDNGKAMVKADSNGELFTIKAKAGETLRTVNIDLGTANYTVWARAKSTDQFRKVVDGAYTNETRLITKSGEPSSSEVKLPVGVTEVEVVTTETTPIELKSLTVGSIADMSTSADFYMSYTWTQEGSKTPVISNMKAGINFSFSFEAGRLDDYIGNANYDIKFIYGKSTNALTLEELKAASKADCSFGSKDADKLVAGASSTSFGIAFNTPANHMNDKYSVALVVMDKSGNIVDASGVITKTLSEVYTVYKDSLTGTREDYETQAQNIIVPPTQG